MTNQTRTLIVLGCIPIVLTVMLLTGPDAADNLAPADRVKAEAPTKVEPPPSTMPATLTDIIRTAPHTRQGLTQLVTTYERMSPEEFATTYAAFEERFALASVYDADVLIAGFLRLKDEQRQVADPNDTTVYDRAMTLMAGTSRAINQGEGAAGERAKHEFCKALEVWRREIKNPEAIYDHPLDCSE